MDNQCTPTYTRLWHKEFLRLIVAEMLLCTSCYMTMPFLPQLLSEHSGVDSNSASITILAFVAGLYLSGLPSNWLIQRYRRNKVYLFSAAAFGLLLPCLFAIEKHCIPNIGIQTFLLLSAAASLLSGATFGLAKRTLSCTLLIDKTEPHHRTEANYAAVSVARMAVAVGPVLYLTLKHAIPSLWYYAVAAAFIIIAIFFVLTTDFPFRAPEECTKKMSTDRFFLPQGKKVFLGISSFTTILGLIMYKNPATSFFTPLLFGFLCATIALRFPSIREWKYALPTSMIVFVFPAIALTSTAFPMVVKIIMAAFIGLGLGASCSFLLFQMLGLCQHCQRSTAESTYFLAADGGILLGIALANTYGSHITSIIAALCCLMVPTTIKKTTLRQ